MYNGGATHTQQHRSFAPAATPKTLTPLARASFLRAHSKLPRTLQQTKPRAGGRAGRKARQVQKKVWHTTSFPSYSLTHRRGAVVASRMIDSYGASQNLLSKAPYPLPPQRDHENLRQRCCREPLRDLTFLSLSTLPVYDSCFGLKHTKYFPHHVPIFSPSERLERLERLACLFYFSASALAFGCTLPSCTPSSFLHVSAP